MYTDQTGNFPVVSSWGKKYMMVLVDVDSGSIWAKAMKNRTEGETIQAHRRALLRMKLCVIVPKWQILHNKASSLYKQEIRDMNMKYQLVPPDDHQRNISEKTIQTWKDNFVSVWSGTSEKFPLHLWCRILPQAER